LIFTWGQNIY